MCVSCSRDVASDKAVVWEGYMSARRPSRLFRDTVNVDQCPAERQVRREWTYNMARWHPCCCSSRRLCSNVNMCREATTIHK